MAPILDVSIAGYALQPLANVARQAFDYTPITRSWIQQDHFKGGLDTTAEFATTEPVRLAASQTEDPTLVDLAEDGDQSTHALSRSLDARSQAVDAGVDACPTCNGSDIPRKMKREPKKKVHAVEEQAKDGDQNTPTLGRSLEVYSQHVNAGIDACPTCNGYIPPGQALKRNEEDVDKQESGESKPISPDATPSGTQTNVPAVAPQVRRSKLRLRLEERLNSEGVVPAACPTCRNNPIGQ